MLFGICSDGSPGLQHKDDGDIDGQSPGRREKPQAHVAVPEKLASSNNAEACWFETSELSVSFTSSLVSVMSDAW